MNLNIDEILQLYSYSGKLNTHFPIEKFSCNISIRVEQFVDDIDEVICGVLRSQGGSTDFNTLADILGLSVYDKPDEKKYKDNAEVEILHQLLSDREAFYLLSIDKGGNPQIALTDSGLESIDTKTKYQYYNAPFTGYVVNKFKGIAHIEILNSFDILPKLGDLRKVKIDELNSACFLDKDLYCIIQNLCSSLPENQTIRLLSFKEPNAYNNFDQPIIYKLYEDVSIGDEIILAYYKEKLLYNISTSLNAPLNQNEKSSLIRDIKFETIWQNPDTTYDSDLLKLFLDKWNWIELLDKNIKWIDWGVWEILNDYGNVSVWNKISLSAPYEGIVNQIHKWIDRWNWTTLSERLPDDIILSNIDNPFLHWDFDVLSLKENDFVRAAMTKIQSYNDQNKEQKVQSFWNFYDVTETLDDNFIIEALSANAAINFQKLSQKPYSFVSQIFKLQGPEYSNWDYDFFSQNWTIEEILNEVKIIGQYINWHSLLSRIAVNEQSITQYLKSGRINEVLIKYINSIKSFTTENLLWDAWLIDYLDSYSLILWQTTRSQKGFDTNEYVDWNEQLLQKYIRKFASKEGKTFFSTKVQTIAFIRINISFDFDWVAIFDNLENNEALRKDLSGDVLFEFRKILPWKDLSSKIKSDKFILNNVLKFREYFDFEVLSSRHSNLVEALLEIPDLTGQDWNWSALTQTVSDRFILDNFNAYSWDYLILSSKEPDFIEKAILSNEAYNLHWDWDKLANSLSADFIIQILPVLNTIFGLSQPIEIQQFWHKITKRLDRSFLKNTANKYLFQWDWSYITKELFTKDEILNNLDSDAGYWDWQYLLSNKITTNDLEDKTVYLDIQLAKRSIADEQKRKETIVLLTQKLLHNPELLIYWMNAEKNNSYDFINMDWGVLSNHKQFIYSDTFIADYVHYWNWDLLSANKTIFRLQDENGKLNADLVDSVKNRLGNQQFRWNWSVLSRNNGLVKNFKILSDRNIIRKWDWAYISEFSEFINANKKFSEVRYLYNTLQDFIDWKLLSRRKDIHFNKDLLTAFSNKNWDWQYLSESSHLEIDNEFLIQLQANSWNWMALSKNKNIRLTLPKTQEEAENNPGILISLKDKEWDWDYLSERKDLEVNYQLIKETKDRNWNYKQLTTHFLKDNLLLENYLRLLSDKDLNWSLLSSSPVPKFTNDFINEFKEFWDWKALSSNKSVVLTRELVTQFNNWDFSLLTKRLEIIGNPQWIFEQKNMQWDWDYISLNDKFLINDEFIDMFSDQLNFTLLSSNSNAKFTPSILKKYYKKWDYYALEKNYMFIRDESLLAAYDEIMEDNPNIHFMDLINRQQSKWKGYIYHHTHLQNLIGGREGNEATGILYDEKIKARDYKAFLDVAGKEIANRREEPKHYARFYFRPLTPYQFYNEGLGLEYDHNLYAEYAKEGFPKCPSPIFIRFPLERIFDYYSNECYVTDNNFMCDENRVTPWRIGAAIQKFDFIGVFKKFDDLIKQWTSKEQYRKELREYKRAVQQEFIIWRELDFSIQEIFNSMQIICSTEQDKTALLTELKRFNLYNKFHDKVRVDTFQTGLFFNDKFHKKVTVDISSHDSFLRVFLTDNYYKGNGIIEFRASPKFIINFDGYISNVIENNVQKIILSNNELTIELSTDCTEFEVWYNDESKRAWKIYHYK